MRRLAGLLVCVMAGVSMSGEFSSQQVGYDELVELRVSAPCLWDVRQPLTWEIKQYALASGEYVVVFSSGGKPREIVIDAWRNGELMPDKDRFVVVVGDGTAPDDGDDIVVPPPPVVEGIGPEVAAIFTAPGIDLADIAAVFQAEAATLGRERNVSRAIARIKDEMQTRNLASSGALYHPYLEYVKIMEKYFRHSDPSKRVQTVDEHIRAYEAIARELLK